MLKALPSEDRLRLMKFVCSFAWADLEVREEERKFIGKLIKTLDLDEDEAKQVEQWLEVPPRVEELDPAEIPRSHRELFLDAVRAVTVVDGRLGEEEAENLALLELLTR